MATALLPELKRASVPKAGGEKMRHSKAANPVKQFSNRFECFMLDTTVLGKQSHVGVDRAARRHFEVQISNFEFFNSC